MSAAALALDDIRALMSLSKFQDKLMNDARLDRTEAGEYIVSIVQDYANGDIQVFQGTGKTPFDAFVALSKELREWAYGKGDAIYQHQDYESYVAASIRPSGDN